MPNIKYQISKIKNTNKKLRILISGFLFCVLIFGFRISCYAQDKIIAVVNNEIITQKDLNDFVNFIRLQLSRELSGRPLEEKIQSIKQDLLYRLIEDRLILQEAKKIDYKVEVSPKAWISIKPDESRIRMRLSEIKKRYPSEAEFQSDLAKQGLVPADVESKIREQLILYNTVEYMVKNKVLVTPDEVTSFYKDNSKEFINKEVREFDIITLENEDLARSFAYDLKRGAKLEDLATRYPLTINRLNAQQGEQLRRDIEEVVFKLGINEVSNPVKIDDRYYVFKLINIIPAKQSTLSEAQGRIHAFLFEKKMQEKLNQWLDKLKAKSYISISQ